MIGTVMGTIELRVSQELDVVGELTADEQGGFVERHEASWQAPGVHRGATGLPSVVVKDNRRRHLFAWMIPLTTGFTTVTLPLGDASFGWNGGDPPGFVDLSAYPFIASANTKFKHTQNGMFVTTYRFRTDNVLATDVDGSWLFWEGEKDDEYLVHPQGSLS